jgi:hypothetical protein
VNVGEVKSRIEFVARETQQAGATLARVHSEIEGIGSMIDTIRETAVDPIGRPNVTLAAEKTLEAIQQLNLAVWALRNYGESL